ncbi:hypothetical protein MPDQ_002953 [Monascus purpureus]|uniref:ATP-dependent RNA helicase n=1 Tax=Monascus purpureus TaxID=5098 RepID=A0A507QNK0_MONPU|nr:hypothetical protein MPDQ_002953 [Monascus purpureus]
MLGAVRRYGVVQALRASAPRALCSRSITRPLKWQRPSQTVVPGVLRFLHNTPTLFSSAATAQAQAQAELAENELEITKFAKLAKQGIIDPSIIYNVTNKMKLTTMTPVQSMTIPKIVEGTDTLAQAKTGTGKTLAFLAPVLQNVMNDPVFGTTKRVKPTDIRAIIISPTRELAEQIKVEADKLARDTGVVVQCAVGGTRKWEGLQRIVKQGCHVLIGTPGRLKDILSDPRSGVKAPELRMFVLDEADRLLDDGFAPDIDELQRYLPDPLKVDRQTLMFSATVPKGVMSMVRRTMKPDFQTLKTVRDDEVPTHLTVPQKVVWLNGYENALPAVMEIAKNYISKQKQDRSLRPFKAIVFFNSTAEVRMAASIFSDFRRKPQPFGPAVGIFELHSRFTQNYRTRNSEAFRKATSGILLSSDVSARGMDFPNVTHVIQIRTPRDVDTYVHRLGRTARANKTGEGWILVHEGELASFKNKLEHIPIHEDTSSLQTAAVKMSHPNPQATESALATIDQFRDAVSKVNNDKLKEEAYKGMFSALLGDYNDRQQALLVMKNMAVHGYQMNELPQLAANHVRAIAKSRHGLPHRDRSYPPRDRSYRSRGYDNYRSPRTNSYKNSYKTNRRNEDEDYPRRFYD